MTPRILFLAALIALPPAASPQSLREFNLDEVLPVETSGHVDQYFRRRGVESYLQGRAHGAREYFRYAAKYADKTSQLSLALLHRNGEGGPKDLPLAYAWFDLAAERGYPSVLAEREAVWHALDEAGRARAVDLTTELYAQYGDAVAKPRHAKHLRRYLRKSIASHPSLWGGHIIVNDRFCGDAAGFATIGGCRYDDYFFDRRFDPRRYWAQQDALWMPGGQVEVRPLQVPPTRARR